MSLCPRGAGLARVSSTGRTVSSNWTLLPLRGINGRRGCRGYARSVLGRHLVGGVAGLERTTTWAYDANFPALASGAGLRRHGSAGSRLLPSREQARGACGSGPACVPGRAEPCRPTEPWRFAAVGLLVARLRGSARQEKAHAAAGSPRTNGSWGGKDPGGNSTPGLPHLRSSAAWRKLTTKAW